MVDTENNRAGIIFNIQRYSIHDGPGIRTTVFIKGCPLRCYWCQNPESQERQPEIFLKKGLCTLCGKCLEACAAGAIRLGAKSSLIDRSLCIGCGKCAAVCPNEARMLIGRYVTVDYVMSEVLKDVRFYRKSGGGVTLSGGDPADQPDFCVEILRRCKEAGLHTAIETAGFTTWEKLKRILEYTDYVLMDIKCVDEKKHYSGTGIFNRVILENAKKIYRIEKRKMIIRIPIIPGFNDAIEELKSIKQFVERELEATEIELLPYNNRGENKYLYLDREAFAGETQSDDDMCKLKLFVQGSKNA